MLLLSFLFFNFLYSSSNYKSILNSLKEPDSSVIYIKQIRFIKEKKIKIISNDKIYYFPPYMIYEVSNPSQTVVFTPRKIYYFFHYLKKKDTSLGMEDVSPWDIFIKNFKKGKVNIEKKKNYIVFVKKKGENIYRLKVNKKNNLVMSLTINNPFEKIVMKVIRIKRDKRLNKKFLKKFLKKELDKFSE